jgi:plasmid stabilization system protein ParE
VTASLYLLKRAQTDLEEILRYLATESPDAGGAILASLLEALERLRRFPRSGARPTDRRLRALGYRVVIVERYLIFYKETATRVTVYRVLHQRRAWSGLL